jgi:hypothetical protein
VRDDTSRLPLFSDGAFNIQETMSGAYAVHIGA